MIRDIIKKHLRIYVNQEQIDKVAKAIEEEIGEKEVVISGHFARKWVKLKELY